MSICLFASDCTWTNKTHLIWKAKISSPQQLIFCRLKCVSNAGLQWPGSKTNCLLWCIVGHVVLRQNERLYAQISKLNKYRIVCKGVRKWKLIVKSWLLLLSNKVFDPMYLHEDGHIRAVAPLFARAGDDVRTVVAYPDAVSPQTG